HIFTLLGGRNRLQAMINLGARYIAFHREAGAIVGDVLSEEGKENMNKNALRDDDEKGAKPIDGKE
ncbi:MAG TPA: NADH dehydrogenase FAD-containing subunit, partial [Cutibacterium acnes]|nr:NADH dehydrogenase FAD-containing subunit [Cutibacterium acnes]